jgi:hypothetical protein
VERSGAEVILSIRFDYQVLSGGDPGKSFLPVLN